MLALLRSFLAVLAGIVVGGVVNMGIILLNVWLFGLPFGVDLEAQTALREALANAPPTVYLLPLLAHAGGTLVGAWLAALLAGRAPLVHGLIIGAFFLIGGILNLRDLPHPLWFGVVDLGLYLPAGWLGGATGKRRG